MTSRHQLTTSGLMTSDMIEAKICLGDGSGGPGVTTSIDRWDACAYDQPPCLREGKTRGKTLPITTHRPTGFAR